MQDIVARIRSGELTDDEAALLAELVLAVVQQAEVEEHLQRAAETHAGWVARRTAARAQLDARMTQLLATGEPT